MSSFRNARQAAGRSAIGAVLGLVLVLLLGLVPPAFLTVRGAEPAPEAKKAKAKAREVAKSLRALNASVKKQNNNEATATVKLPERPGRIVTTPTLSPAGLDALVEKFLESSRVPLSAPTTDVEFVRRAYLDLTGKLPTPDQVRAFVKTNGKGKRAKLIEYLLNSPEYTTNWAHYWRDVIKFRATNEQIGRIGYEELEEWMARQLSMNRPWDEIASDLITATGRTDENGAVVFSLAHDAQAVELAGEVSRIFLGVQIQCAQCHDHPNDSWKRQQFHEFAAFFANEKARRASKQGEPPVFEIVAQGKPRYTMPDKQNPQKQIFVAPKFFLAEKAEPVPNGLTAEQRIKLAASYVTGQDNPWFAKAFINRVWYVLMGDGFFNPVDDIGPERTAKAPVVIETLATEWAKGGYDIKWLFRTLMNSKAYQREVRSTYTQSGRTPFAAVCPTRLRSDQIWDALAQALNLPSDRPGAGPGGAGNGPAQGKAQAKVAAALTKELKETVGKTKAMANNRGPRNGFNTLFGVDPSTPYDDVVGTIPQALYLMNSSVINSAIAANPRTVLGQILMTHADNREALVALYLRVLARAPNAKEVQVCGRYLDAVGNRAEAFEDILWSLINSTEFITRR
jgi:hypothetical protein